MEMGARAAGTWAGEKREMGWFSYVCNFCYDDDVCVYDCYEVSWVGNRAFDGVCVGS
jgi:hypothetical protein